MARRTLPREQVLTLLAETPRRIDVLTADLAPAQLQTAPDYDKWSANDVLAHLRSCADVCGGCVATILTEDHPTIRAINPKTWIKQTDYPELEFPPSLRAFSMQRVELLAVLEPRPDEDWSRAATVTGAGSPLERTVHTYAAWLARHERSHYKQFERNVDAIRG